MNKQKDLELLLQTSTGWWIGIVIAILILAGVVHFLRSWYRDRADREDQTDEILQQMRELHAEGDLSEEEFRSIKSQLTKSID